MGLDNAGSRPKTNNVFRYCKTEFIGPTVRQPDSLDGGGEVAPVGGGRHSNPDGALPASPSFPMKPRSRGFASTAHRREQVYL
jgi:hypothetical protein